MISNISEKLSSALVDNYIISSNEKEEYNYAIACQIESFLSIGTILLLAVIMDKFIPVLFYLVTFLTIRKRCGGFHCTSFIMCYFSSIALVFCVICVCLCVKVEQAYTIVTTISYACIFFIGAVNNKNMNLTIEEYKSAKESTRLLVLLFIIVNIFIVFINLSITLIHFYEMGIITCALLLVISKIKKEDTRNEQKERIIEDG